jgi:hypothetical protein
MQTYYLTVDLSIPQWVYRNPEGVMHFGRGGYHADQISSADRRKTSFAKQFNLPGADIVDEDEDDEPLPEVDEAVSDSDRDIPTTEDVITVPPEGWNPQVDNKLKDRKIEILDLHTNYPVISYRGKVFEGRWAEVLGTEMLFMRHEPTEAIPRLRRLPDNIDLLAASTARLLVTEKKMRRTETRDPYKALKDRHGLRLMYKSRHRTDEKMAQAKFLEDLWAVKVKRGERDMPTTIARPPPGQDFEDYQDPDRGPMKPRGRAAAKARMEAVEARIQGAACARAQQETEAKDVGEGGGRPPEEAGPPKKPGQRKPLPFSRD